MDKYRMARAVLLLLGAGACIRGAAYAVGVVYAACPMAAVLLLVGCVCVLFAAVANWRDTRDTRETEEQKHRREQK